MRIVFMGTPDFAVSSLDLLLKNNLNIVGVVTAPDKAAGRGQLIQESAVKKFAVKNGLRVLQPEKLKSPEFLQELQSLKADLQIVVAFRMLPESVWNMPIYGTYNLHASLLPQYRGAAPINWAIINGEKITGVTTFKLRHEIDAGNVLLNRKVNITENMNAGELHDLLMKEGSELLLETVKLIETSHRENRELQFMEQNDKLVSHAPKIYKDTCKINWNEAVNNVYNLIRGLSPYPGAFSDLENGAKKETIKIFRAEKEMCADHISNGSLICDNKSFAKVKCADGYLHLVDIQLQGRKRMLIEEFLRGYKFDNQSKML
jgi:methionyl-tRNA formyltransferase